MAGPSDIQRLIGDVVRLGTIATVDHAGARCTVTVGDLSTGPIPWLSAAAGSTTYWSPPSVGEQVILLCPEGDIARGMALRGIFSTANAAPSASETLELVRFVDGATLFYDTNAHQLRANLPAGGKATIKAPAGITLAGPVTVKGPLTVEDAIKASGDVVAGSVSLQKHLHDKVQPGMGVSGKPVAL
jgi:phage baseplate assembly protein V